MNINEGDLVFIRNSTWDVWLHAADIGRIYEADVVPEGCAVIVVRKFYKQGDLIPNTKPIFQVTSGNRTFWMATTE
jgi:hypothetical protein